MNNLRRLLAALLFLEAASVTYPALRLQAIFEFPSILRKPAAYALTLFAQHQSEIVSAYYVFLLSALLFVPLSFVLKRYIDGIAPNAPTPQNSTLLLPLGVATAIFQAVGFSRWVFAVPMLSDVFQNPSTPPAQKEAAGLLYDTLNRYGGMTIGEHLGFIAMGAWTLCFAWLLGSALQQRVLSYIGYAVGAALLVSVGEHFGGKTAAFFSILNLAANTLWMLWLMAFAVMILRKPLQILPLSSEAYRS